MNHFRRRLMLLSIVLLFGAPVVVAIMMHSRWWNYQPATTLNHGTLIEPVRPLDYTRLKFVSRDAEGPDPLAGQWTILYPVAAGCPKACLSDVVALRQIHRAAGRRQDHLSALLLLPADSERPLRNRLRDVYDVFLLAYDRGGSVEAQLRSLGETADDGKLQAGQAFLVDPAGNIMMRYAAGFDTADLNEDLKRLLKWSAQDG